MSYIKTYWKQKDCEIFGAGFTPGWNFFRAKKN